MTKKLALLLIICSGVYCGCYVNGGETCRNLYWDCTDRYYNLTKLCECAVRYKECIESVNCQDEYRESINGLCESLNCSGSCYIPYPDPTTGWSKNEKIAFSIVMSCMGIIWCILCIVVFVPGRYTDQRNW